MHKHVHADVLWPVSWRTPSLSDNVLQGV